MGINPYIPYIKNDKKWWFQKKTTHEAHGANASEIITSFCKSSCRSTSFRSDGDDMSHQKKLVTFHEILVG